MKRYGVVALLMALIGTALRAAEPIIPDTDRHHVLAFAASNDSGDIEYRYMFHDSRLAVIALFGYSRQTSKTTGVVTVRESTHALDLGLGLRHNFMTREQLRPFVQLDATRSSSGDSCGSVFITPVWGYSGTGGAEYFLGRRFSVEGRAGVRYTRGSSNCAGSVFPKSSFHEVSTFRSALAINFYF